MDPVSAFLAATISAATTNVKQNLLDIQGTEIKTEVIDYQGMKIPFQYQLWRIRNKSVCSNYSQSMKVYSQCSLKAKYLFNDICDELSSRKSSNWKVKKMQNMYCNAAIDYKPIIASISNPKEITEKREKEKQCNLLILKTMGNNDSELIAERDLVCGQR